MAAPRRRPSTNDLFKIFPDFPRLRRTTTALHLEHVQLKVQAVRARAGAHILRQRAATEGVRAALARRRRGL
jgi:hypothetical protein